MLENVGTIAILRAKPSVSQHIIGAMQEEIELLPVPGLSAGRETLPGGIGIFI
jgi:hypothetical protein